VTGIYLFEAKSIQSYLGRSGRLKNVVEVSDALSNLIDDNESSRLCEVMRIAGLLDKSDLISSKNSSSADIIRFFRAKGGSFYCWSSNVGLLERLRSFWLLYFQSAFPEMVFNDVLVEGDSDFHSLLDKAFKELQVGNNRCQKVFPCAGAIAQSTPRTGSPAVGSRKGEYQDLCSVCMSQIQNARDLKLKLYSKTIDSSSGEKDSLSEELIKNFAFMSESKVYNDIALIHLDGNGMGQILMALKDALKGKTADDYTKQMRKFSGMLEHVTVSAVQKAMVPILRKAAERDMIPFYRPLVIGGDDVTLLMEPCYAYDFVIDFCREFRSESEKQISKDENLKKAIEKAELPAYLTASGGILFNKKSHPFFNSLRLVEGLAEMAKSLTKHKPDLQKIYKNGERNFLKAFYGENKKGEICNNRLYSAVAVFRMSAAETGNVKNLIKNSRTTSLSDDGSKICVGSGVYFVNNDEFKDTPYYNRVLTLEDISDSVTETMTEKDHDSKKLSKIMGRMRRITGHIMSGACSEYRRELTLMHNASESDDSLSGMKAIMSLTDKIVYAWDRLNCSTEGNDNYIRKFIRSCGIAESDDNKKDADDKKKICIFGDLIVAHHFINGKYDRDSESGNYANWSEEEDDDMEDE
jgi:hypothetical protein